MVLLFISVAEKRWCDACETLTVKDLYDMIGYTSINRGEEEEEEEEKERSKKEDYE